MGELEYLAIRKRLSAVLRRDAGLHWLKRYERIGDGYMDLQSALRFGGDQRYQKLIVALNFWDAWILARNTDWFEHDQIPESLWPVLGLIVAADLDADHDITDPRVRRAFDLAATFELPKGFGVGREALALDGIPPGFDFED